jgi:hypothetical protein
MPVHLPHQMMTTNALFGLNFAGFAANYSAINVQRNRPETARQRSGVFCCHRSSGRFGGRRQCRQRCQEGGYVTLPISNKTAQSDKSDAGAGKAVLLESASSAAGYRGHLVVTEQALDA